MRCVNRGAIQPLVPSVQFQVLPAGCLAVFHNILQHFLELFTVLCDRPALVRERQGDAAPAGEQAVDFHQRDQGRQFFVLDDGEIEGFVSIGFTQDPGPGGGVEKGGLGMGTKQFVPIGVLYGVDDLNVQWNGYDLMYFN